MFDDIVQRVENYGATRDQLVDLTREAPEALRYLDLVRAPEANRPVAVLESQGQPRAYIFLDKRQEPLGEIAPWVRRIAFRGDADYLAVLRPGQLDVYPAVLRGASRPERVEDLPDGLLRFPMLLQRSSAGEAAGVRAALRNLLQGSLAEARSAGVDAQDAISLVGRALFWRFLIDRQLLQGLEPSEICGERQVQTFADCLVTRARALKTFSWLDQTFNGSFLPFRNERRASEIPEDVYRQVVGNIAHAADADGQLSLSLPSQWRHVNFAHVPVGLLSEVYEAYAHQEDAHTAESESIFYTPRHIAEFMVDEALASLVEVEQPRVLDPAAGAGVFLVAVFRALVAREWERTGSKPPRRVIRRILYNQLTGFDINEDALRLAELALYLTAIELDPQRDPRPLSLLRFERPLRETVLQKREGGLQRGSLDRVEPGHKARFDLVIGNPPWTAEATLADKLRWVEDSREVIQSRLGAEHARRFTLPDSYPDIPFIYRAMEWARPGGQIALVTHARWLFPGKADEARRDLLQSIQVTGILNGTALRDTGVWPGSRAPFAMLFAINRKPEPGSAFQFVSPLVSERKQKAQRLLHVDWNDAHVVSNERVIERPWLLKARFRGVAFDENIVHRLETVATSFEEYLGSLGTEVRNGFKVGNQGTRAEWLGEMLCIMPRSRADRVPVEYRLSPGRLKPYGVEDFERSRERRIYEAPLLLIRQSPPVDFAQPRSAVADFDVAFPEAWQGVSFKRIQNGLEHARWLQLLLQSSVFPYYVLLTDNGFGVEREEFDLVTLKRFPVVPIDRLTEEQRRSSLQLSQRLWTEGWSEELSRGIDEHVFGAYGLDDLERDSVRDTLTTQLPYARSRGEALRAPTEDPEIKCFVRVLEEELCHVLGASHARAQVRYRDEGQGPWGILQIDRRRHGARAPGDVGLPWAEILRRAEDSGSTLVTVRVNPVTTLVAILRHYRYWTPTRARMLALSLLEGG